MRKMNENWYALRWSILNRDKFTCQYCGRAAPEVVLHVDHKIALADGGDYSDVNLTTACSACNIGKGLRPLNIPQNVGLATTRKPTMIDDIIAYLSSNGPADATKIASAIHKSRTNVCQALNTLPVFEKAGREKHRVLFTISGA